MTVCTLVAGGDAAWRDGEIAARLDGAADARSETNSANAGTTSVTAAVIREGMPSGKTPLTVAEADGALQNIRIVTIAPACPCCGDGIVLRVTLDRLLRLRPAQLYISLADASHLSHLHQFLAAPPYGTLVSLAPAVLHP